MKEKRNIRTKRTRILNANERVPIPDRQLSSEMQDKEATPARMLMDVKNCSAMSDCCKCLGPFVVLHSTFTFPPLSLFLLLLLFLFCPAQECRAHGQATESLSCRRAFDPKFARKVT